MPITDKNCCYCNPNAWTTDICPDCEALIDETFPKEGRVKSTKEGQIRTFESGATRDIDQNKPDYEGFLSPYVIKRFGKYMHKHRKQSDGSLRDSDNWQRGIPLEQYMKSGKRHFIEWWATHRGLPPEEELEDTLCALLFNVSGYLHEILKKKNSVG
jgi:hypothetical protein